jgi:mono/diheme cytochrome c family protein
MPSYAHLPENELEALVAYLLSLRGGVVVEEKPVVHKEVPPEYADVVNPFPGDETAIAAGRAIYEAACVPCHGLNGDGQGPAAASLDPPPTNFTDATMMAEVSEAMMFWRVSEGSPGTGMPPWKDRLSEEEIWQVINYERTFAK